MKGKLGHTEWVPESIGGSEREMCWSIWRKIVNFKRGVLFLCILITLAMSSGCGYYDERRILRKGKKVLSQKQKKIEELVEVRGSLKRIVEMKVQSVNLLNEVNRLLGQKYMAIGSYHLAEEALLEAEYFDPHNAFIKKDLGECYYFLANSALEEENRENYLSQSKLHYERAVDIKPDLIVARYGLGLLLFFGFDDVISAINEMKVVLDYEPNNVDAHFALGRFYYEIDEPGKSLGEYITLTNILPKKSPKREKVEENIIKLNTELGAHE